MITCFNNYIYIYISYILHIFYIYIIYILYVLIDFRTVQDIWPLHNTPLIK